MISWSVASNRKVLVSLAVAAVLSLIARYLYARKPSGGTGRSIVDKKRQKVVAVEDRDSNADTSKGSRVRISLSSDDDVEGTAVKKSSSGKSSASSKSHKSGKRSGSSTTTNKPTEGLPDFIMLMGIPGCGKSTWAKEYVFKCDASFTIVSSDEIRRQLTGSVNDQSRNDEVWEVVLNQVVGHLKMGRNVILDATNVRSDHRRTFVRQLPPCNKYLKVIAITKAIAKNRISKDVAAGVDRSTVPDVIMEKMYASFLESQMAVKDEGWLMKA